MDAKRLRFKFPKKNRILKRSDFLAAQKGSTLRLTGKIILIDGIRNELGHTRLGVTVTKKYGKAVSRNRFKRIVRGAFRHAYPEITSGYDIIIRPRSLAKTATSTQIQEEITILLSKSPT